MIKLGTNSIGKIYLGSNSIGKAYLGSNLVFQKGSSPTPPTPPTPTGLIYELESPVSTNGYDTGVKLFDTAKSFTILCDATWNNYPAGSWKNGVFGITTGNYFRFGTIGNGYDYRNGEILETANRYSALIMNTTSNGTMCTSVFSRSSTSVEVQRRFAVRYNHQTRVVEVFITTSGDTTFWYTVSGDIITNTNLKLLLNNTEGTVNVLKIYDSALDVSLIVDFIGGN